MVIMIPSQQCFQSQLRQSGWAALSPALDQQSRRRTAQEGISEDHHKEGEVCSPSGGAKRLWGKALDKGDGKVCSRTALLIWPQGNVQRDE